LFIYLFVYLFVPRAKRNAKQADIAQTDWDESTMMKVPWTEHKTNEEILQTVETEREIMDTVRSRQKT